jgi:hypothetical protein
MLGLFVAFSPVSPTDLLGITPEMCSTLQQAKYGIEQVLSVHTGEMSQNCGDNCMKFSQMPANLLQLNISKQLHRTSPRP